jgi:1,4-alpha-glucan branching enzyme
MLTDYDLHLFGEGRHWTIYEKLGAHPEEHDGVRGVTFAVWAPNADGVSIVGDFNGWDATAHPMHRRIPSGDLGAVRTRTRGGHDLQVPRPRRGRPRSDRSDPYGFGAEVPPRTASQVVDLHTYEWQRRPLDGRTGRAATPSRAPLCDLRGPPRQLAAARATIPQRWLSYADLERELVPYVVEMGFTHVEFLPPSEHPLSASWGYQTIGLFAATSRFGPPQALDVAHRRACHRAGVGVIIDWVPAHFPKSTATASGRFDGTALYEHEDPRKGEHPDWGTMIFNYGRNEVRQLPDLERAVLARASTTSTACAWTRWPRCSTSTTAARTASGSRTASAAARISRRSSSSRRSTSRSTSAVFPGTLTIAEESTAWPGVSRPTYTWAASASA